MSERSVDIKSLVGIHELQGVGREITGDSQVVALRLDGAIYVFTGEGDGYRNSVDSIERVERSPISIAPVHPPLVCNVCHRDQPEHYGDGASALYFVNEQTGLVVLDIGTDNIDDWYPSFVFTWQPEGWRPAYLGEAAWA